MPQIAIIIGLGIITLFIANKLGIINLWKNKIHKDIETKYSDLLK